MLKLEDLIAGDLMMSHKKPEGFWGFVKKFFNWRLKRFSIRKYGKGCRYPHMDHDRRFMGWDENGVGYVGHWTDPAATYDEVEQWMIESTEEFEVHVFRPKVKTPPTTSDMFRYFAPHCGTLYDIFDLPAMEFGITKYFHGLGKKNMVCSTGSRDWDEKLIFKRCIDPDLDPSDTPPCYGAQYPELYEQLM